VNAESANIAVVGAINRSDWKRASYGRVVKPSLKRSKLDNYSHITIVTSAMDLKPLYWVGQSKKDYAAFPEDVHDAVGYALHKAQGGDKHPSAKPLKGFSGAGVLEVVEDHAGDTFRAVYTVRPKLCR
jgi:hypothetical protein